MRSILLFVIFISIPLLSGAQTLAPIQFFGPIPVGKGKAEEAPGAKPKPPVRTLSLPN
jgi:hypothetical protein